MALIRHARDARSKKQQQWMIKAQDQINPDLINMQLRIKRLREKNHIRRAREKDIKNKLVAFRTESLNHVHI